MNKHLALGILFFAGATTLAGTGFGAESATVDSQTNQANVTVLNSKIDTLMAILQNVTKCTAYRRFYAPTDPRRDGNNCVDLGENSGQNIQLYNNNAGAWGLMVNAADYGSPYGVYAKGGSFGVYGESSGWAGYFAGNTYATGEVQALSGLARFWRAGGEGAVLTLQGSNGYNVHIENINGTLRILNHPWNRSLYEFDQNGNVGIGAGPWNGIGWPGSLNVNGSIRGARYYDDDTGYYADLNQGGNLAGNWNFNGGTIWAGAMSASSAMYTPTLCLNGDCRSAWPNSHAFGGLWSSWWSNSYGGRCFGNYWVGGGNSGGVGEGGGCSCPSFAPHQLAITPINNFYGSLSLTQAGGSGVIYACYGD